jgi:hypothetical protein
LSVFEQKLAGQNVNIGKICGLCKIVKNYCHGGTKARRRKCGEWIVVGGEKKKREEVTTDFSDCTDYTAPIRHRRTAYGTRQKNGWPFLFFVEMVAGHERFYSGQEHRSAEGGKVAHIFS